MVFRLRKSSNVPSSGKLRAFGLVAGPALFILIIRLADLYPVFKEY